MATNTAVVTKIWVFFYGSYMDFAVLREVDYRPTESLVATLSGYDIVIGPRANLVRSTEHVVYGVAATATHAELDRLYSEHAQKKLGELYLPHPVLIETLAGTFMPALTYICPHMTPAPADPAYVGRITGAARSQKFPEWYIRRLESQAP